LTWQFSCNKRACVFCEWLHQSIIFWLDGSVAASLLQYRVLRHIKRAAISCVAARFCDACCSSLHDDATRTSLQCVARRCTTSCRFLCRWALARRSHRLAGLALLLVLPAHVAAQLDDANIGTAALAWLTDPVTAATTYGPIADWNTAAVTSMAELFFPSVSGGNTARPTFNADISKWNVGSVSNMYSVRLSLCSFHLAACLCLCLHTYVHT
jgi:hypothetical protein